MFIAHFLFLGVLLTCLVIPNGIPRLLVVALGPDIILMLVTVPFGLFRSYTPFFE